MTRYLTVDFETKDLSAKYDPDCPVWCVGLAERLEDGLLWSDCFEWEKEGKAVLRQLNEDDDVQFIFYNASFDVMVARTQGVNINPGKYDDAAIMGYLTKPITGGYSLADWGVLLGHEKIDYHDYSQLTPEMMTYCKRDVEVTLLLYEYLVENFYSVDDRLAQCYYDIELPYVEVIMELENTGIYIDKEKLEALGVELKADIDISTTAINNLVPYIPDGLSWDSKAKKYEVVATEYKDGFNKNKNNLTRHYTSENGTITASDTSLVYDHCPLIPFNPNSTDHLAYALMGRGWKPKQFSKKTTKPVCNAEVVEEIDDELATYYLATAEKQKLLGTFVDGLLTRADVLGCVRGSFNQTATKTTRLSSSSPK